MMGFDSHDHHHHLSEELLVDCGYTKVIASRVGALGTSIVRAAKPTDFTRARAKRDKPPYDESSVTRFSLGKLRKFNLAELEKATANFSDTRFLGRGGFGIVYKGILSDGAVVAVKVMDKHSRQGLEQFQAEMRASCAITGISHPNLVPAIGYLSSPMRKMAKTMIVYPFMANGDVRQYLGYLRPSSLTPLDWTTRKRIALEVARGISSLHELGIVHGDIKPANVMLDEDFKAHVGDLGLAKFMGLSRHSYNVVRFHGEEDTHCHYTDQLSGTVRYMAPELQDTHLSGTVGYMAPELHLTFRYSRMSDVYAFGLSLIQIVTGMPSLFGLDVGTKDYIVYSAERLFKNDEDLTRHMHFGMSGMYEENEAIELIRLGLICTQVDPEKRPLMPEVIAMMEGSSANLKQRWDNYDYTRSNEQWLSNDLSETECYSRSFYSVEARGIVVGDDEEVCCSYEADANEEELEENEDIANQLQAAEDFASEESNKEHQAGNIQYPHHGYQSGVSCDNSVQPDDSSSGVSGVESTSLANSISPENDTLAEIVQVDQNERGNPKQLSSQANRYEGPSGEVATKLREMLDQMREMELKYQDAMEEMHQKQIAIMQSMIKMQGEHIQKVNEMQSQIDQLKGLPQKP